MAETINEQAHRLFKQSQELLRMSEKNLERSKRATDRQELQIAEFETRAATRRADALTDLLGVQRHWHRLWWWAAGSVLAFLLALLGIVAAALLRTF